MGSMRAWFTSFVCGLVMPVISAKPHGIYPHVSSDRTSHIFRHLQNSQQCRTLFNPLSIKSDKHLISPYNDSHESHVKVTRMKEMITN